MNQRAGYQPRNTMNDRRRTSRAQSRAVITLGIIIVLELAYIAVALS